MDRREETAHPGSDRLFPQVGALLRKLRKDAGLTQEQVAQQFGLTFAGYRPYERGERELTMSHIEKFAEIFKVPVSEITRRLWPEDVRLIETSYSAEFAELQRQVASLPPEQAARVIRGYWQSVEIAHATDLARRN